MASFDYSRAQNTSQRLIERFGQPAKLVRHNVIGSLGSKTTTETEYNCTVALFNYTLRERENTLIKQGDMKALVSPLSTDIVPTTSDKLRVRGKTYTIQTAEILSPAGVNVLYKLQVRT